MAITNEILVSYAWGGESERTVDELEQAFAARGLKIVRDKKDLGYKGSIAAFEARIGQGGAVIVIVNDKYLRSKHCMNELVSASENKNLRARLFPVVLADAQIYSAIDRLKYIQYWDSQIAELNQAIKAVAVVANLKGITDELDLYDQIRDHIAELTDLLGDMNTLTPQIHAESGYSTLIDAIQQALQLSSETQPDTLMPEGPVTPSVQINTGGGAYIAGNVDIGGDFIGRDRVTRSEGGNANLPGVANHWGAAEENINPWEQRIGPGMGGSNLTRPTGQAFKPKPPPPARFCQELKSDDLFDLIERQTDLAYYPMIARHTTPATNQTQTGQTNQQIWQLFTEEALYDTRRVTLTHFHLFEWFPMAPGRFHTPAGYQNRQNALELMFEAENGRSYFNPWGKADMLRGGVGAVRLRPRLINREPHYFMTASANGVCHEGFPVLVPGRFYGQIKPIMLEKGAVPVTLSGEMRYIFENAPAFFGANRDIPQLYLHVDTVQVLAAPRSEIDQFTVSVPLSFIGEFDGREGVYCTYASFNPASRASFQQALHWLEQFYVAREHKGVVITDFDEVRPRFPNVVFGLPDLMAGKLAPEQVSAFLKARGYPDGAGQPFFVVYKEINTQGGAYIAGDLHAQGGDFIGRDQIT